MREDSLNTNTHSAGDLEFLQDVFRLLGATQSDGLGVAIRLNGQARHIEVVGSLPKSLRQGLVQAVAWDHPLPRRSKRRPCGEIVWRLGGGRQGGVAFNVPSIGALVDLVAKRAELLADRAARRAGGAA